MSDAVKPVSLTLSPRQVAIVLEALVERPYKHVYETIETISRQYNEQAGLKAPPIALPADGG